MDIEKIANLIKTKRKEKGLTQSELADKLNVTEKAISRWETARGTPDISLLIPLSKTLGISTSELLNGKEDKKASESIEEIINYIDINKRTKNKYIISIVITMYSILLLLYLWYLKTEYNLTDNFHYSYFGELLINLFFIIGVTLNNKLLTNYFDLNEDKNRIKKITYIIILVIYMIMFFNMTIFGRGMYGFTNINLVPFRTIIGYFIYFDTRTFFINVLGNIVILMPVEYLILKIFNINKFYINLIINFIIVWIVEIIQHFTSLGVLDIDDMLLNILGMSIIYFIVRKHYKLIDKYKSNIIILLFSIILTLIIFDLLNWYYIGNVPTIRVFIRLLFGITIIYLIIIKTYKYMKKKKSN